MIAELAVAPHVDWHRRVTAALWLAEQGYSIVPIPAPDAELADCTCPPRSTTRDAGGPCGAPGKHPRGAAWQKHATRAPELIRGHLRNAADQYGAFPAAGSGLLVIDCDDPETATARLPWPDTLGDYGTVHSSGAARWHRFFRLPAGYAEADVPRSWDGGEVRVGGSGQVVGPWSQTIAGPQRLPFGPRAIAELPAELIDALRAATIGRGAERKAAKPGEQGWILHNPGRHDWLAKVKARHLRGVGLAGDRLRDELRRLRDDRCCPGGVDGCPPPPTDADIDGMVEWAMANIDDDPPPIRILTSAEELDDPEPPEPDTWPEPIGEAAYHGVAGELVRAVADSTEADPVALLGSILATAGALFGRWRTIYQGAAQGPNLYVVLVGDSSTGRKGTAGSVVREMFGAAYPGWDAILVPGLGSGEGLIGHLNREADRAKREDRPPEHRTLVMESELGRLLTIMARDGSTLSPTLRDGWDGAPLGRFLAREDALVTWHHVGLLGHITPVELRAKLTSVDAANGFGNRFLWLAVRRSRLVPFPGNPRPLIGALIEPLHRAIREAQVPGELAWTTDAADRWEVLYADLATRQRLGLAGAITARAEAQIARLALTYALLDRSAAVDVPHLEAGLAFWEYAERSAVHLFGDSTGNRHADLVLRLLRAGGELDRQGVKQETGLRLGAEIDDVIRVLTDAHLVDVVKVPRPDGTARRRRVLRLRNGRNGRNGAEPAHEEGN